MQRWVTNTVGFFSGADKGVLLVVRLCEIQTNCKIFWFFFFFLHMCRQGSAFVRPSVQNPNYDFLIFRFFPGMHRHTWRVIQCIYIYVLYTGKCGKVYSPWTNYHCSLLGHRWHWSLLCRFPTSILREALSAVWKEAVPGHRVAGNVGQCGRTKEVSCQPWNVPGSDH